MIVINDKNIFVHFSTECFKYILFLTEWNLRAPMIAKIWRDLPEHTREAYKVVNYFNFFPQEFFFFFILISEEFNITSKTFSLNFEAVQ